MWEPTHNNTVQGAYVLDDPKLLSLQARERNNQFIFPLSVSVVWIFTWLMERGCGVIDGPKACPPVSESVSPLAANSSVCVPCMA